MILLGSPEMDARVIKTARSLAKAGYRLSLFCLAPTPAPSVLPCLEGIEVRWVTATRPLARLLAVWRNTRKPMAAAKSPATGVEPRRRLVRDFRGFFGTLWLNIALWKAARHQPASVIHTNDLDTLLAGVLLKATLGARLLYDAHELYPEMIKGVSALYSGLWRLTEHLLIGMADGVVTVNATVAHELQRRHHLKQVPTVVMNCPPLRDEAPVRDLSARDALLIYQGMLNPERGLEELVRAIPALNERAVLCLRGPGPLREALSTIAMEQGVAGRLRILPPVPPDELVTALDGFTIGLIPYLPNTLNTYLSTPTKMFEYMMAGLPIVAADLPEVQRIIESDGVGVTYPAANVSGLIGAVNTLLADPERMALYAAAGRSAARREYHWDAQAERLLDLYAELANGG
jgi:glycosyltransferase involved in cell wall biosynthesis